MSRRIAIITYVSLSLTGYGAAGEVSGGRELVANPTFTEAGEEGMPAHWSLQAPAWRQAACTAMRTSGGLLMRSGKTGHGVGCVRQALKNVKGGQSYRVAATV